MYQRFEKNMWSSYYPPKRSEAGDAHLRGGGHHGTAGDSGIGEYRDGHYTIYFYLTHSMDFPESDTVRNGYTPLVFQNDRLVGIGKRDYRHAVEPPEAETAPNLPWPRTQ